MSAQTLTSGDETLIIETPERVQLHFALASIGNRFLACAFDHALQVFAMLVISLFVFWLNDKLTFTRMFDQAPKWLVAVMILVLLAIWCSYFIVFEWLWNGQTPGKRWLKLRVIRDDGRPISFFESCVRNLMRIFDMMPFPFYSIGLITVFASPIDQRIGDMLAGTVVVREREVEAPSFDNVFATPISDSALRRLYKPVNFSADISTVTDREIEVVEAFLRRRLDLPDSARQWMAWRVATPILYKIRPNFDAASFTYEGFLEEILGRYLEQNRFSK